MTEQVMHYTRPFGQGIWDPAPGLLIRLHALGKAAFPREVTGLLFALMLAPRPDSNFNHIYQYLANTESHLNNKAVKG